MLTKALLTALAAALVVAVSPAKADGGNASVDRSHLEVAPALVFEQACVCQLRI